MIRLIYLYIDDFSLFVSCLKYIKMITCATRNFVLNDFVTCSFDNAIIFEIISDIERDFMITKIFMDYLNFRPGWSIMMSFGLSTHSWGGWMIEKGNFGTFSVRSSNVKFYLIRIWLIVSLPFLSIFININHRWLALLARYLCSNARAVHLK